MENITNKKENSYITAKRMEGVCESLCNQHQTFC